MTAIAMPAWILLDPLLQDWLREDLGRGDRTTQAICANQTQQGKAELEVKQPGVIAGLPLVHRVFQLLDHDIHWQAAVSDGDWCECLEGKRTAIAQVSGRLDTLLMGERVALNLVMHLSGIATATRRYVDSLAELPTQLVDTRKTTPGLRLLEKYASQVGGAINHRMGLDDAVMIKDNHILAAGSIATAIALVRQQAPFPLAIEVETESLAQVQAAIEHQANIIMLDNMPISLMQDAVQIIRHHNPLIKIEASGNITLDNLRAVAATGVDYISTSATITRSPWLDCSLNLYPESSQKRKQTAQYFQ
ncbi:MAG: carboxylating nicotinate-nucleotide diphosphorylase [Aphanocapsa sp. GSE-SYN-MK-11-07L]|jgi:nicotinate-nucleotide pyrophosphorylase (carboxylating)|nr:carboxylating nicotinate-nucleotide diphosphorylase [Aphanocapsa sp. GSE-SYN-MK-11-07L]